MLLSNNKMMFVLDRDRVFNPFSLESHNFFKIMIFQHRKNRKYKIFSFYLMGEKIRLYSYSGKILHLNEEK